MILAWTLFALFTLIYAWRGYRQGVWLALARIIALIVGYGVAYFFADDAAAWVQQNTRVQGMAAWLVCAIGLFLVVSTLVGALLSWLQRRQNRYGVRPLWSSVLGALTGGFIGAVMGLAAVYAVGFVRDTLPADVPGSRTAADEPAAIETVARDLAARALTWIGDAPADAPEAKLSAALVREPQTVVRNAQELARSDEVASLVNDPAARDVLTGGDVDAITALPAFKRLLDNPNLQALLATAGIEQDDAAIEQSLSGLLTRFAVLQTDAKVQALLNDPELQAQAQSGNPAALLNDPRVMELVQRVLNNNELNPDIAPDDTVYRWVDEAGEVHYGDKPPNDPDISAEKVSGPEPQQ